MKNKFTRILLFAAASFITSALFAQNVAVNMLVLNSGIVPLGGDGTLKATINAGVGTAGQSTAVPAGKINLSISVPPSVLIAPTQSNIPAGWTVRNNDGAVINICNSSTTIVVNTAVDILIDLQGVSITSGSPTMSGQLTFKTNCTAPGSLSGDNPSDNSSQAGYTVTSPTPVSFTDFNASLINCQPALSWVTETEVNSDRYEIEKLNERLSTWNQIGVVAASGNSSARIKYSFVDHSGGVSSERVLYRIKMIDRNGRYKYSTILPVLVNCKTVQVNVYPNPVADGNLKVSITGAEGNTNASIMSVSGQVVLKMNIKNGTNSVNILGLADGTYLLRVNFGNGITKSTG